MTTYPLPTLSVTIDASGISAPAFNDILLSLQAQYKSIYGVDVDLDPDTQDGQWLAIAAKAINDNNQSTIAAYMTFSPSTAIGAGLSSVVKTNGIARLIPSFSSVDVLIVGQAGTTITNGSVGDSAGFNTQWNLPTTVNVPPGGSVTVTATCTAPGAVAALANTITKILTPTAGWQTVNNPTDAAPGNPVETDAELRARQTHSTALPSQTPVDGIFGAISNLPGVSAVSFDDNDTGSTDANGVPEHTLAMVVQGGDLQSIVNIVGLKKTIGCNTFGNTSGTYIDFYGFTKTIFFSRPTLKTISVAITVTPLPGFSTVVSNEIKNAVAAYINALGIGNDVLLTRVYGPALLQGPFAVVSNKNDPNTYEINSLLIAISPATPGSSDLVIAFDQIAICDPAVNVTVT